MKYPDNRLKFTAKDVSRACGVSRSTLLRMEESGFLKPYYIDPDSGYRYYDADNITQIGQYLLFMDLGLSRKEAADMYYHWGKLDTEGLLEKQKFRISRLQRLLNQLEMRYEHKNDYSFFYAELPEMTCLCVELPLDFIKNSEILMDIETLAYDAYQNAVKDGYRIQVTEPLFVLMPDSLESAPQLCIPVISSDSADHRLQTFPACQAFSITAHGDGTIVYSLMDYAHSAFSARKLKAAGRERLVALVAPYVGKHIDPKDHCYEYVIPMERI